VITEKVKSAEQVVLIASSALENSDYKLARQEIEHGKNLLFHVVSYRYPYRQEEIKRVESSLFKLEQDLKQKVQAP
jgi:hypothetical protein